MQVLHKFIIDLFDNNGNFISLDRVKELKVKTHFVEYAGLKIAIFTNLSNKDMRNNDEPIIPNTILPFYKNTKGCKDAYNPLIINKQKPVTSLGKWKEEGNNFTDFEWNQIFQLPFKTTLETKLQWLQFQILHRIVPTNLYFSKLKLIDTPSCTYCNNDIETIYHLF